jgi:hypothetical protein
MHAGRIWACMYDRILLHVRFRVPHISIHAWTNMRHHLVDLKVLRCVSVARDLMEFFEMCVCTYVFLSLHSTTKLGQNLLPGLEYWTGSITPLIRNYPSGCAHQTNSSSGLCGRLCVNSNTLHFVFFQKIRARVV